MRSRLLGVLCLFVLLASQGCVWWNRMRTKEPFGDRSPCVLGPEASREDLVEYLNKNISGDGEHPGLKSWRTRTMRVHANGFSTSAEIAVAAPRLLRLWVNNPLTRSPVMDFGSNNERFWLWAKADKHQAVMTCAHADVPMAMSEMQMNLPFQPDWLMEVLGVIPLDPHEFRMERPSPNGPLINLIADRIGPTGEEVERVIQVNACHGIILDHELRRKSDRRTIARASLSGHYRDPETQIIFPKQIRIDWPDMDFHASLEFGEIEINPAVHEDSSVWTMQEIPGYKVIDIGQIARERGRRFPQGESRPTGSSPWGAAGPTGGSGFAEVGDESDGSAPPWMAAADDDAPEDENDPQAAATIPIDGWETPQSGFGRIRVEGYESSATGEDESSAFPAADSQESSTIRMQSQSPRPAPQAPPRRSLFNWLWGRTPRPEAALPSAYSPGPSRSSSVPRLPGRE